MKIEQRWVVGAGPDCDVVVADEYASRAHCEVVRLVDGHFLVRDLGSTNGTWIQLNPNHYPGFRVTGWTLMKPGMTLVIGRSKIPWNVESRMGT